MEITMRNLLTTGTIDLNDFLHRADVLAAVGKTVLISDYFEYYRLAAYLTRYTDEPIAVTRGISSLQELFTEEYYSGLEGGIREAFGKLFTKDLHIYVYPLQDQSTGAPYNNRYSENAPGTTQPLRPSCGKRQD